VLLKGGMPEKAPQEASLRRKEVESSSVPGRTIVEDFFFRKQKGTEAGKKNLTSVRGRPKKNGEYLICGSGGWTLKRDRCAGRKKIRLSGLMRVVSGGRRSFLGRWRKKRSRIFLDVMSASRYPTREITRMHAKVVVKTKSPTNRRKKGGKKIIACQIHDGGERRHQSALLARKLGGKKLKSKTEEDKRIFQRGQDLEGGNESA